MKIGIYGGTFNPVHKGHTSLAKSLVKQGLVDEVWLMVSPLNPFKKYDTSEFADYNHRFRMTELAVLDLQGLKASDFENHLPVPSYMYTTLKELSLTYPKHEFVLVIGADNWLRFKGWYRSEDIIRKYQILIYRRPGYEFDENLDVTGSVTIVDTPLYDISSTELRRMIYNNNDVSLWVDKRVIDYIKQNHLYK